MLVMEIWESFLDIVVPPVEAQSYDGVTQPTFGQIDVSGPGLSQAQLNLTASSTTVGVGSTFDVSIEIETGDFEINEFQIILSYDTQKLTVVDAEPSVSGTQVQFLDSIFTVDSGDNNVGDGKITLIARTPSGNALQVNRVVGSITFQAQEQGSTVIQPVTGIEGSKLINANGIALNASLNSLTLNIGTQTSSSSQTISTSTSSSSGGTNTNASTSASSSAGPDTIPETGILDGLPGYVYIIIGIMLMAIGAKLATVKRKQDAPYK